MVLVSTLYVLGFPLDVRDRDLKNFCRFLPGFVAAHVSPSSKGEPPALFVKFATRDAAVAGLHKVHGQPFDMDMPHLTLSAELARRDMDVGRPGPGATRPPAPVPSAPAQRVTTFTNPAIAGGSGYGQNTFKRPLTYEDEIMTLTVLGTSQKGFSIDSLQEWFKALPGCAAIQVNEKLDGIFVKFDTRLEAENAIVEANAQNLGAEWARRNLESTAPAPLPAAPVPLVLALPPAPVSYGRGPVGGEPLAKRPHQVEGGDLRTITVLGMTDKGLRQDELEGWFRKRHGFVGLQVNTKLDGMFAKFATSADAEKAMLEANNRQYRAEWARRNLDLGKEHELNTITILGATEKGLSMDELQQWFRERPGFQALKVNERIDGLFVRFLSGADAAQAIQDAGAMQFPAEWAHRNLD